MHHFTLYRSASSDAVRNAQRNLMGRTHYVDPDSLSYHRSRILETHITDDGTLFTIIESYAADYENTRRLRRFVTFDVCGHVVSRVSLDEGWNTTSQARKAMWAALNEMDGFQLAREAIKRERAAADAFLAEIEKASVLR